MINFSVNTNKYEVMQTIAEKSELLALSGKNDENANKLADTYISLSNPERLAYAKSSKGKLDFYAKSTARGKRIDAQKMHKIELAIVDDLADTIDAKYVVPSVKLQTSDFTDSLDIKMAGEVENIVDNFLNVREYLLLETGKDIFRMMKILNDTIEDFGFAKASKLNTAKKMQKLANEYIGLKEAVIEIMADKEIFTAVEEKLNYIATEIETEINNIIWVA